MKGSVLVGVVMATVAQVSFAQADNNENNLGLSQYMDGLIQTAVVSEAIEDYINTYEQCPKDLASLGITNIVSIEDSPIQGMQLTQGCELTVTFKDTDLIAAGLKGKILTIQQEYDAQTKRIKQQCTFNEGSELGIQTDCQVAQEKANQLTALNGQIQGKYQQLEKVYKSEGTIPKLRIPMAEATRLIEHIADELNMDYLYKRQCPVAEQDQRIQDILHEAKGTYVENLQFKPVTNGCLIVATFKNTAPVPDDLHNKVVYKELTFSRTNNGYSSLYKSNAPKQYRGIRFHEGEAN